MPLLIMNVKYATFVAKHCFLAIENIYTIWINSYKKTIVTYIKAHSIQVHLSEFYIFVLFSSLSAFS